MSTNNCKLKYKLEIKLSSSYPSSSITQKQQYEHYQSLLRDDCGSSSSLTYPASIATKEEDLVLEMNQYYQELLHESSCLQFKNCKNNEKQEHQKLHRKDFNEQNANCTKKPFISNNVEYMKLYQISLADDNEEVDDDEGIIGCSCKYPPFIAIVIPMDVTIHMDFPSTTTKSSSATCTDNNRIMLSNILSQIHPSLTYLEPCGFFQTASIIDNDTGTSNRRNSFDLLLLKLNNFNDDDDKYEHEHKDKNDYNNNKERNMIEMERILEDINGESMILSPHSVIQAIPISYLSITTTNTCSDSSDSSLISLSSEIPLCPVCRFRIEPRTFLYSLDLPKQHHRCSSTNSHHNRGSNSIQPSPAINNHRNVHGNDNICQNMQFLSPWEYPTYCEACHILQERLTISGAKPFINNTNYKSTTLNPIITTNSSVQSKHKLCCYKCEMKETLWVCLTCGTIGCGRYSHGHAEQHYKETNHPYSLELATQRIWDYGSSGSFVSRNDLLNCKYMQEIVGAVNRAAYQQGARVLCSSSSIISCDDNLGGEGHYSDDNNNGLFYWSDGLTPKKAAIVGEEYEALLQSALEDQAQHFELEIAHLVAQLASEAIDMRKMSAEQMKEVDLLEKEISELRADLEVLSREYVDIQEQEAGHRGKSNILLREQGVTKQLLDKIRDEATREHREGTQVVEELEQQVRFFLLTLEICEMTIMTVDFFFHFYFM